MKVWHLIYNIAFNRMHKKPASIVSKLVGIVNSPLLAGVSHNTVVYRFQVKVNYENVIPIILAVAFVPVFYVKATTKAIDDSYNFGISVFKSHFYTAYFVLLVSFFASIFVGIYAKLKLNREVPIIYKSGFAIIASSIFVMALGQLPCFYPHVDPHTFETLLKQSLLCPSYSNRSYLGNIPTFLVVFLAIATSKNTSKK